MGNWIEVQHSPIVAEDEESMILVWHVYHGVMVEKRRRLRRNRFFTHWQEIDNEAWISVKDRAPTRDDADVYNCVIARNRWGDMMTAGWHRFAHETDLTDWQHPPAPPEDFLGLREKYEEEELH